jgi:UDP-glucose 4-epimerase
MNRNILITGARGYLGGRLLADLRADKSLRVAGSTRGAPNSGHGLVHLDPLADAESVMAEALQGFDVIVHLSAANEIESARDPVRTLQTGAVGTLKLLRAAQTAGCRRFLFLSTIHVYGAPLEGHITEDTLPRPVHPYAICHRAAEDFVLSAHAKGEMEAGVLRLSNGIGAPAAADIDRWTLIGNDLCRQAMETGRIVLHSSGLQWRDFILLRDFVQAIQLLALVTKEDLGDGLFNLGGELPLRILDIAHAVAARAAIILGRDIMVEAPPPKPGENFPTLDYGIAKIKARGFRPSSRAALNDEIDATLRLCRAASENAAR